MNLSNQSIRGSGSIRAPQTLSPAMKSRLPPVGLANRTSLPNSAIRSPFGSSTSSIPQRNVQQLPYQQSIHKPSTSVSPPKPTQLNATKLSGLRRPITSRQPAVSIPTKVQPIPRASLIVNPNSNHTPTSPRIATRSTEIVSANSTQPKKEKTITKMQFQPIAQIRDKKNNLTNNESYSAISIVSSDSSGVISTQNITDHNYVDVKNYENDMCNKSVITTELVDIQTGQQTLLIEPKEILDELQQLYRLCGELKIKLEQELESRKALEEENARLLFVINTNKIKKDVDR